MCLMENIENILLKIEFPNQGGACMETLYT